MRKLAFVSLLLIALLIPAIYFSFNKPKEVIVFCAGSLYAPLQRVANAFEKEYGISVRIEPSGSVLAVRKVTDLGKRADVVAVADYSLIRKYMFPKYAKWVLLFASNKLVLAYTDHSKMKELVQKDWLKVIEAKGIRVGISNPNLDPCGYRSVGALALKAYLDGKPQEFFFAKYVKGISAEFNDNVTVYVKPSLEPNTNKVIIRDKSVDLITLLETGEIDYAFEYLSVAKQHNLKYVLLPDEINLGNPKYKDLYSKVTVVINYGTQAQRSIRLKPIIYGLTIPTNAPHPKLAKLFVEFLLKVGPKVFNEMGMPFLKEPKVIRWTQ